MKKLIICIVLSSLIILGICLIMLKKENTSNNTNEKTSDVIPVLFEQEKIFANQKLQTMSIDEKIGQLFLVRIPEQGIEEDIQNYQFGGLLYFAKDFKNLTKNEVQNKISNYQSLAKIPMLMAVDEEGGTVSRISSNKNLVADPFLSPSELYQKGGLEAIKEDTIKKTNILSELGLNLNLAPVVDITLNKEDYMYERSLQEDAQTTSEYAQTVIQTSDPTKLSFTLKHFPGYGNNTDTHQGISIDTRDLNTIKQQDLKPFIAGINAQAEAVLISHNIVTAIDSLNPASLSKPVHDLLKNELHFTGIIITDNLDMAGVDIDEETKIYKALTSGNDLLITTDYKNDISIVKKLLSEKVIDEELINEKVVKILAWKYYKKLI